MITEYVSKEYKHHRVFCTNNILYTFRVLKCKEVSVFQTLFSRNRLGLNTIKLIFVHLLLNEFLNTKVTNIFKALNY